MNERTYETCIIKKQTNDCIVISRNSTIAQRIMRDGVDIRPQRSKAHRPGRMKCQGKYALVSANGRPVQRRRHMRSSRITDGCVPSRLPAWLINVLLLPAVRLSRPQCLTNGAVAKEMVEGRSYGEYRKAKERIEKEIRK